MNRWCVVMLGVLLAGCAGTGKQFVRHELPSEVDHEKVAAVNQWASTHGAVVTWVHMPTKVRGAAKEKEKD